MFETYDLTTPHDSINELWCLNLVYFIKRFGEDSV